MIKRYNIILALVAVMSMFASCKDDKLGNSESDSSKTSVVELGRMNSFYNIETDANQAWIVTESPEWAGSMNDSGAAGESITLFVETNEDDEDRNGIMTVEYANGEKHDYTLHQLGKISDQDNGTILSPTALNVTYGVGYTLDAFGTSDLAKYSVRPQSPINFKKLVKALAEYGEADAMVDEDRYFSRTEHVTGNTTSAVSNQLSINAGIEVGVSAFKLSVEGGYEKQSSGNDKYTYALQEIQHIVKSRHIRPGVLRYFAENGNNIFQGGFRSYIDALSGNSSSNRETIFKSMLDVYGTHLIVQGSLGGELKLSMKMKVTDDTSESDIHAALNLSSKVVNVDGEFKMNNKEKSIASNTTISLVTYGGYNVYSIAPGETFETFQKTVRDKKNMEDWVSGIRNGQSLALIDAEVMPIYDLMPTDELRNELREYMVGTYQKERYAALDKDYKGPDLYVLKGLDLTDNMEMECNAYIPEIDIEVIACRTKIKELSETEYSTVIYSGEKDKVGRKRGFFVGSDTRKPCKFQWKNDGSFETEVFEKLSEGSIAELYVDATGDITIYPKGVTSLYREVFFSDPTIDVTNLDYPTVTRNCVLTGKTSKRIIVQRGLEVSLNNLHIIEWGSLDCWGDNKIILSPGSKNIIDTDGGASISNDRSGTLTIGGTGSLTIRSDYGVGIGCSGSGLVGGDIVIEGGNIDISAGGGAAIGTLCNGGKCGNIKILGGTITATTSWLNAAAIGTCDYPDSECGDIFIGRGVEKLTVGKGEYALDYIGRGGMETKCGKVTIEDASKIIKL